MTNYLKIGARYPWLTMLVLVLATIGCIPQLFELKFNISAEEFMLKGDKEHKTFEQCLETFGEGEGVTLYMRDSRLLQPDRVEAIRSAVKAIDALPCVNSTFSLFSLKHVWVDDADEVHSVPYLAQAPQTEEERGKWLRTALRNPMVPANLLASDGHAMAVWIQLRRRGQGQPAADEVVTRQINEIVQPLRTQLDEAFIVGSPVIRHAITQKIVADQKIILPSAIGFLLLILMLVLHRLSGAIVPLLTAGLSLVWTLAFMGAMGIPFNVMTSMVPALLVVVGSTEDIHLLAEYYDGINQNLDQQTSLERMATNMSLAVFLTFFTTALGFLSIAVNPIPVLQDFGVVSAVGLGFNFLITALLTPAWLRLQAGRDGRISRPAKAQGVFQWVALQLLKASREWKHLLFLALALLLVFALVGATRVRVNNDPLEYFRQGEPVLEQFSQLQTGLTGGHTLSIVLDGRIDGTFTRVRYLQVVRDLQRYLDSTGLFRKSLSFADIVALTNTAIGGGQHSKPSLPEQDDVVREYLLFLGRDDIASFVSEDYSRTRILVRHEISSSLELERAISQVNDYLKQNLPRGIHADITGAEVLTNHAAAYITFGQAISLGLVLLTVWVLVGLLFVNARAGLIALLPNLLPIALVLGVVGYQGISLGATTAMFAVVALGICVDNTMHFMVRFHRNCNCQTTTIDEALYQTVRSEATPIFSTSLALAAGFGLLLLSAFPPIGMFGLLSALVILMALLSAFLVTPLLLSSMRLLTLWDMLDLKLKRKVREECQLFQGMSVWQIKKLILVSEVRTFEAGEKLFRAGDWGNEMYVVLDGEIEVSGDGEAAPLAGSRHGHGDLVGETALLGRNTRSVTAMALKHSTVLVLHWDGIRSVARIFPRIAARLFFNLSRLLEARLGTEVTG